MRGERLKMLRENAGISQEELAVRLNFSEASIWRYEHGTADPRADSLLLLAQYFNVSTDYLLGLSDHPGTYIPADELTPNERAILDALRRGDRLEAVKLVVGS